MLDSQHTCTVHQSLLVNMPHPLVAALMAVSALQAIHDLPDAVGQLVRLTRAQLKALGPVAVRIYSKEELQDELLQGWVCGNGI